MQIRIIGNADLVMKIRKLLGKNVKVYPSKADSEEYRIYLNYDDAVIEQWIDLIENSEYPIEFDPKDFR